MIPTAAESAALRALGRGPLTVAELANECGYSQNFMQAVLYGLTDKGLVNTYSTQASHGIRRKGGRPPLVYALIEGR